MISYVPFGITIDEPKRYQKLYIIVVVSCRLANDSWQTIYQALWQTTGLKNVESQGIETNQAILFQTQP